MLGLLRTYAITNNTMPEVERVPSPACIVRGERHFHHSGAPNVSEA